MHEKSVKITENNLLDFCSLYKGSKDTPICGVANLGNVIKSLQNVVKKTFLDNLNHTRESCNCLPACTTISYDTETSQTDYDFEKHFLTLNSNQDRIHNDIFR